MAKSNSTRAIARKPSRADLIERIRLDLIGVRACLETTQAVLQGRPGFDEQLTINLIRGGVMPVRSVLERLNALEGRS